jgi:hypothetical protein
MSFFAKRTYTDIVGSNETENSEIPKHSSVVKLDSSQTFEEFISDDQRGSFFKNGFHLAYEEGDFLGEVISLVINDEIRV